MGYIITELETHIAAIRTTINLRTWGSVMTDSLTEEMSTLQKRLEEAQQLKQTITDLNTKIEAIRTTIYLSTQGVMADTLREEMSILQQRLEEARQQQQELQRKEVRRIKIAKKIFELEREREEMLQISQLRSKLIAERGQT